MFARIVFNNVIISPVQYGMAYIRFGDIVPEGGWNIFDDDFQKETNIVWKRKKLKALRAWQQCCFRIYYKKET